IENVAFSLDQVLENLANLTVMRADEKGLEILFNRDLDIPDRLIGDPLRLEQVLINLTSNAIKFTERGEVIVSVQQAERTRNGAFLRFAVKDTGIGIDMAELPRLFDAFTQQDGSTTRRFGGSGLGLSICQNLIQLMQGMLEVESEPGKGSVFSFTLPFGVQEAWREQRWIPGPDLRGMRVLVVDDNPSARELLSDRLASFTFNVSAVSNAAEALKRLEQADKTDQRPFRLVLMDWRMPGLNGIEAGRRIKRNADGLSRVPAVILVTAYGREEVMLQVEEAGLDGVLIKPVTPSILFDTIMRAMGHREVAVVSGAAAIPGGKRLAGQVLLVEDNIINQQVAKELLENLGLTVSTVGNGREALDALEKSRVDLVLMDLQMPEMDGYEATRRLRADNRFASLPVIAMTAHALSEERERCLANGMNEHVPKPIDPEQLFSVLSRWLQPASKVATENLIATQADDDDEVTLPDQLPGIDLGWGLERVGGNRRLFRKLLGDFVDHHGTDLASLKQELAAADFDSARRRLHTLQGVAGNIGARDLQQSARRLEQRLVRGAVRKANDLPQWFMDSYRILFDGLSLLPAQAAEPPLENESTPRAKSAGKAGLAAMFDRLDSLLSNGDADAKSMVQSVAAVLEPGNGESRVALLIRQIENYDFDRARETLVQLQQELGAELETEQREERDG
ncbi:MAG: response regulator, partial [Candidatus Thiodiazotropha sp.]